LYGTGSVPYVLGTSIQPAILVAQLKLTLADAATAMTTSYIVPCPPELTELLHWHIATFGTTADGRLFRAIRSEGRLGSTVYGRTWAKARGRQHSPRRSRRRPLARRPYDLRHACLSTWLAAGVDPAQVAEWAGHSLKVLMEIYAKLLDKSTATALARIDAAFGR
jgi:integrase